MDADLFKGPTSEATLEVIAFRIWYSAQCSGGLRMEVAADDSSVGSRLRDG